MFSITSINHPWVDEMDQSVQQALAMKENSGLIHGLW
jgi:hypothetical protein